ncbi:metallophosphoesterase [Desulfurivibrio alkaliphilus]|uniref:Phosphoesterase n=1 Tax=Desulfurivibrio alkaliphilus (strain DSM 19089 / UNIQEM U267 / AHT2) TaxID=589865 RepID=D6Z6N0_DESAT|nr:metallophosphoesterase [Desulfurivibrio alkaliphilus]ADH84989.1 phosphodiesterase, MJ0936 family [Desulfurivibrio alkaliphilus AHT 2]
MRIAVISDTHDHIANLRAAVTYCNSYQVGLIIHCGDLVSPFMLSELAAFGGAVHLVYGNNPGDKHLISQFCGTRFPGLTHHGDFGALEAAGLKFAFTHYPQLARGMAAQGNFDVVCCGHNHRYQVEKIGETLLINPGELLGKDDQPGFAVLDALSRQVERVEIGDRRQAGVDGK